LDGWRHDAPHSTGFESGSPLAPVALETAPDEVALRTALARAFATLRERIAMVLEQLGELRAQAQGFAASIVATYQGGLFQAQLAQSDESILRYTKPCCRCWSLERPPVHHAPEHAMDTFASSDSTE